MLVILSTLMILTFLAFAAVVIGATLSANRSRIVAAFSYRELPTTRVPLAVRARTRRHVTVALRQAPQSLAAAA